MSIRISNRISNCTSRRPAPSSHAFHRRTFLQRTLGAAVLGVAGGLVSFGALAAQNVKIGTVIWIGYGPYYVADQLNLFKKSGLKVDSFKRGDGQRAYAIR